MFCQNLSINRAAYQEQLWFVGDRVAVGQDQLTILCTYQERLWFVGDGVAVGQDQLTVLFKVVGYSNICQSK